MADRSWHALVFISNRENLKIILIIIYMIGMAMGKKLAPEKSNFSSKLQILTGAQNAKLTHVSKGVREIKNTT